MTAPHPTPAATPTGVAPPARRGLILAAVCLAAFAINLDTTIINVALPSLTRQLHAGTTDLQWIVAGYSLSFSALVLAAGSLGDRYGRRPALLIGLVGFGVASGIGALCANPGQLIAARFVMGMFAALIFPTTLSVITNTYPDREQRVAAIGAWGAVTGLGVAVGPVTGGLLLKEFSWPSVFVALVPVALLAAVAVFAVVPESRDPATPPVDRPGLLTASVTVGSLVYTIIEAPTRGWASTPTLVGFAIAILSGIAFVLIERDSPHPMLDVKLFRTPAFSAASGSVTIAFFALFGFIFLITQYFQFIRGYGTLSTGVRILPVALSLGLFSVLGANFAARLGTRAIVCAGLVLLGAAFAWIAQTSATFPYPLIAVQMVMMGSAMGLITTPATESILSVLPPAKAGVGSAVNDATRETGGTLGVAIIGSVYTSLYVSHLTAAATGLPHAALAAARSSVGAGYAIARRAPAPLDHQLIGHVQAAFLAGLHAGCYVAAGACLLGILGAVALPGRAHGRPESALAPAIE
jgi:EmrB/QacA subfamily drug resistance transporter